MCFFIVILNICDICLAISVTTFVGLWGLLVTYIWGEVGGAGVYLCIHDLGDNHMEFFNLQALLSIWSHALSQKWHFLS